MLSTVENVPTSYLIIDVCRYDSNQSRAVSAWRQLFHPGVEQSTKGFRFSLAGTENKADNFKSWTFSAFQLYIYTHVVIPKYRTEPVPLTSIV